MKKYIIIFLTILVSKFTFGQSDYNIKSIFYGLPIEEPRSVIQKALLSDNRFKSTCIVGDSNKTMYTYTGLTKDNGVILSKSDSVIIHLTYAFNSSFKAINDKNVKGKPLTILRLEYYYSTMEIVEKEYQNILNILKPIIKDTIPTFQFKSFGLPFDATGMTFKNNKPKYSIEVLKANIEEKVFGLLIEYVCDENKL